MLLVSTLMIVLCWIFGHQAFSTKISFTVIGLVSLLMLVDPNLLIAFHITQLALALTVGISTFGVDWLTQSFR